MCRRSCNSIFSNNRQIWCKGAGTYLHIRKEGISGCSTEVKKRREKKDKFVLPKKEEFSSGCSLTLFALYDISIAFLWKTWRTRGRTNDACFPSLGSHQNYNIILCSSFSPFIMFLCPFESLHSLYFILDFTFLSHFLQLTIQSSSKPWRNEYFLSSLILVIYFY